LHTNKIMDQILWTLL